VPPLRLTIELNAYLVIPVKLDFQLSALSVPLVVLFKLVKIRIVFTAEQGLTHHCNNQMPKNNIFRLGFLIRIFQDLKLLIPLIGDYWKGKYRDISAKSMVISMAHSSNLNGGFNSTSLSQN